MGAATTYTRILDINGGGGGGGGGGFSSDVLAMALHNPCLRML